MSYFQAYETDFLAEMRDEPFYAQVSPEHHLNTFDSFEVTSMLALRLTMYHHFETVSNPSCIN